MADITIQQVREKYPQYSDMSDNQLADALHGKYYSDMPKEEFYQKIGLKDGAAPIETPKPPPKPGFIENVKSDVLKRISNMEAAAQELPGVNPRFPLRVAGETAGMGADVLNRGVEALVPESVQTWGKEKVAELLKQRPGKRDLAVDIASIPERLDKIYAGASKDIGSLANLSMVMPGVAALRKGAGLAEEGALTAFDIARIAARKTPEVIDRELKTSIDKGIEKGIRPSTSHAKNAVQTEKYMEGARDAVKTITENKTNLSLTSPEGETITGQAPKTLKQLAEAIDQTKKGLYNQYHKMAVAAGSKGAVFESTPIITELDRASQDLKLNPQTREYAESLKAEIAELEGQSPEIIEARIKDFNNSLSGYYEGRITKAKAQVDASVADLMRKQLDAKIMGAEGSGYQALKNKYGSLLSIEQDVSHRAMVDARKNTKGLADFTSIFSGGEIVAGLLTMNPMMVVRGGTWEGVKRWTKAMNDPNRHINNMFKDTEKLMEQQKGAGLLVTKSKMFEPKPEFRSFEPAPIKIDPNVEKEGMKELRAIIGGGKGQRPLALPPGQGFEFGKTPLTELPVLDSASGTPPALMREYTPNFMPPEYVQRIKKIKPEISEKGGAFKYREPELLEGDGEYIPSRQVK